MGDESENFRTKYKALSDESKQSVFQLMQELLKSDGYCPTKHKASERISICKEKSEPQAK